MTEVIEFMARAAPTRAAEQVHLNPAFRVGGGGVLGPRVLESQPTEAALHCTL